MATLARVLEAIPPATFCFAYGSAVFQQVDATGALASKKRGLVDVVLSVKDPKEWHHLNRKMNPSHYPLILRRGPISLVNAIQRAPPGIYYVPYASIDDIEFKYGVVSEADLLQDLDSWNTLYLSGRLQKPVKILQEGSEDFQTEFKQKQAKNLRSALATGLLFASSPASYFDAPEDFGLVQFDEMNLLKEIVGISYLGDVRMMTSFTENPHKIENIVNGSLDSLKELYYPLIEEFHNEGLINKITSSRTYEIDKSHLTRIFAKLPEKLRQRIEADDPANLVRNTRQRITKIVKHSSSLQSAKGIITAGLQKSISYAFAKLSKARPN